MPACRALFSSSLRVPLTMFSTSRSCIATPHSKNSISRKRVDRVAEVVRVPRLVLVHPQDAVADVAVLAEDVRVGVVDVVVGVLPLLARADVVPLVHPGVQAGVAHPVVLAVHDVVADLHVVEDLGDAQRGDRERPGRRQVEQRAAGHLELPLPLHDAADVRRVLLAEVGDDPLADGVELLAERVELLGSQLVVVVLMSVLPVGIVPDVWCPFRSFWGRERQGLSGNQRSRVQVSSGRETQIRMSSSGRVEVSPVRTLVTLPGGLAGDAGEADAHPAAELRAEAGGLGLLEQGGAGVGRLHAGPLEARRSPRRQPVAVRAEPSLKYSTRSASEPSYAAWTAWISGAGPHAQVGTSR